MSHDTNTEPATKKQATSGRKSITIIATVEQPRCHKESGWQACGVRPVEAGGIVISSIVGVTALTLSRFMRVKAAGFIESRFGKYQLNFVECEETSAEYKNPILTILSRAGVPKARGEIMQSDLGEDFAQICKGLDATMVARTLAERGMLRPASDGFQSVRKIDSANKRVYVLTAKIFDGAGEQG